VINKDKKDTPILEYTILAGIIIVFLLFIFQLKTGDVNLCRAIFSDLVNGRYGVQKYIDWENLNALQVDVGREYQQSTGEKQRVGYKKAFIQSFSRGFQGVGGKFRAFVNWRIYNKVDNQTIVAADYQGHNKTLLFTLSSSGKKRLTSLQWKGSYPDVIARKTKSGEAITLKAKLLPASVSPRSRNDALNNE